MLGLNPKTFRTLEFLLLVLSNVAAWLLVIVDYMPEEWGVYVTAASGAAYAVWRGLAKLQADTKDYWQTSEFFVALIASVPAVIAAFADTIDPKTYGIIQSLIVLASGVANGLRKNPDVAAGNVSADEVDGETDLLVPDELPDVDDGDDSAVASVDPPTSSNTTTGSNVSTTPVKRARRKPPSA